MFPDLTSVQWYNYKKSDYTPNGTYASDLKAIANSINKTFDKMFLGATINLPEIGILGQPRDKDEDKFITSLLRISNAKAISAQSTIQNNINNPGAKQYLTTQTTGIPVEYLPADNGDQVRKYGLLMVDAMNDSGFRMAVTNYALDGYKTAASDSGATAIPVPSDPYNGTTNLYVPPAYAGFLTSGACSCAPLTGACSNGYRPVYIIKKRDYNPGSASIVEMAAVVSVVNSTPQADGGITLVLKRGLGRVPNAANNAFDSGTPVALVPGDIILFGQVIPTTQCLPTVTCSKATPKIYSYASTTQRMIDCVYEDKPTRSLYQTHDRLPHDVEVAYQLAQVWRDYFHKLGQTVMFQRPNYAAGEQRPIDVVGGSGNNAVEYSNCDVIPYTMRGIFPTIEDFGQKVSHYFTSCNDTCGQFKITKLFELVAEATQGSSGGNDPAWALWGDVNPLVQLQASVGAFNNVMPNNYAEAQKVANMRGSSFAPDAKSLFGRTFDADSSNLQKLRFGDREVDGLHDSTLRQFYGNTMWWLNMNAFQAFAPNHETLNTKRLGSNPYFNATGTRGTLSPYVYTQDLKPTFTGSGNMEFKADKNCGVKWQAYLEVGFHPKANYLPHMTKFSYGSRIANPNFDPETSEGPSNQRYIYANLEALDCSCGNVNNTINDSLAYWTNRSAVN